MEQVGGAGALWSIITIVGPILLAAALIYAMVRNRRMSRAQNELSERATRQNKLDAAVAEGADGAAERLRH